MITGRMEEFLWRANQRGYSVHEVMPCVIKTDGLLWTVDEDHPAYPKKTKPGFFVEQVAVSHGPGTELKALLAGWPFRIVATADCKCTSRAAYMDAKGCDWCEANIEEIVGWLRESAEERGLPFVDMAGRVLVRRAIHNARKAEAARAQEAQQKGPPAV